MSKKQQDQAPQEEELLETAETPAEQPQEEAPQETEPEALEALKAELAAKEDQYLRLAAEYDNFRKRTNKEKEGIWSEAKGSTITALLPIYDNLERAVRQPCTDEAYAKGVEMTLSELKKILEQQGVTEIPALGQTFDPNLHNAVMHVEDETAEENSIVEVFQAGFQTSDRVLRFAMVKVAN